MITTDVIIVGGGPAGSSCAWKLRSEGVDCLVLDRETFPRTKLCAGWITPEVVTDLEIDPERYPHSFLTFHKLHIHLYGLRLKLSDVEHSIRRYEFDHWLLQRSGAPVVTHYVRDIRRENGHYVIDGEYRCRHLVGAGGTKCPVYRTFFSAPYPRDKARQAVVLEQEFPYEWRDGDCHLWFFENGLPGYAWYVPKAGGHLNVGIGGMADKLKRRRDTINRHWDRFTRSLAKGALVDGHGFNPSGYSYYLRGDDDVGRIDDAFVVGDAASLATRDLCEGIGPAVKSGLRAADSIVHDRDFSVDDVARYSAGNGLVRKLLEYKYLKGS